MKTKALLITVVFLLMGALVYGQVSIGPKAGATMASMSFSEDDWLDYDLKYVPGFQVGFLAEVPVTESFAFQPEVLYTGKGYREKDEFDEGSEEYQLRNYYLEVPVLAKYIFKTGSSELSLMAGPFFSYLLNGRMKYIEEYTYDDVEETYWEGMTINYGDPDWSDDVHRFDVGAAIGAGVKVPIGCSRDLFFDFRYNHGFIDFWKWEDNDEKPDDYSAATNRHFSLSMAYMFSIKKVD